MLQIVAPAACVWGWALVVLVFAPRASGGKTYFELQAEVYSSQVGWFAPFHSGGGYCSEARAFAQALDAVGFRNLSTIQHGDSWSREYMGLESAKEKKVLQRLDMINFPSGFPRISICHSEPGAWYTPNPLYHTSRCPYDRPGGQLSYYRIGRTMFETDRLPSGWLPRLLYMDEIWVPTEFSRRIFAAAGVPEERLRVVGETVDTAFFAPAPRRAVNYEKHKKLARLGVIPSNTVVFLFVGKFEERKGIDVLLSAYFTEFSSFEAVTLLLVTSAYHSSRDFEDQITQVKQRIGVTKKQLPDVIILSGLNQEDMPVLYSFAHALVIPSHGEGWGRPHMEAMACETPVVATNWSGPTAFVTGANGYPIQIEDELVPASGWAGHLWAQPKVSHLREILRAISRDPSAAKTKGRVARQHIIQHFGLEVVGAQVAGELQRVERMLVERDQARLSSSSSASEL